MNQKINKNDFLQIVAEKTGVSIHDVEKVYETIVEEIQNITLSGKDVSLTGFGTFSVKHHKGHPVQVDFNKERSGSKTKSIPDYIVFKFSASSALTSRMRSRYHNISDNVAVESKV